MNQKTESENRMLRITKESRWGCCDVRIERKSIFDRHCGQRMQRIKVFYPNLYEGEYEAADHIVCQKCNYNFTRGLGQSLTGV